MKPWHWPGEGCTIDITAFPVDEGEDAWPAPEALTRYLDAGLPRDRVTVSSDGGGCLPVFDEEGRVAAMDVGRPSAMAETLKELLACGQPLERVLPAFTANPARLLMLPRKGRLAAGCDADLVVLDEDGGVQDVMARGRWHVQDGRPLDTGNARRLAAMYPGGSWWRRSGDTSFRWAAPRRRSAMSPSSGALLRSVGAAAAASRSFLRRPRVSETGSRYEELFRSLGVGDAKSLPIQSRADCEHREWLDVLDQVDGVFLTGGNQLRLSTMIGGTEVAKALRRRNAEGMHVAGTSAGAAFLCEHMIAFGKEGAPPGPGSSPWPRASA